MWHHLLFAEPPTAILGGGAVPSAHGQLLLCLSTLRVLMVHLCLSPLFSASCSSSPWLWLCPILGSSQRATCWSLDSPAAPGYTLLLSAHRGVAAGA